MELPPRFGRSICALVKLFCFLTAALAICFGGLCHSSAWASPPNIIMIVSDDMGYNETGFTSALNNGGTLFQTPNLDALAQQSVVGSRFYTTDSICAPSRAALLTGQYQQRYGFEQNTPASTALLASYGTTGLTSDQITVAQQLKDLGYSTGAIGKWHLGYVDGLNLPEDKGFDEFYGFWGSDRQYFQDCCDAHSMRRGKTNIESTWQSEGNPANYDPVHGRYTTDAFGEESVDFINRHAQDGKPFFLYLAFNAEHTPYAAKQADLDHFADIADPFKRLQAAIVYAMDRAIGNVVNSLQSNGIDQNTIVAFTNDNGGVIGANDNFPYSLGKATMSEGGIREPFTYRAPGLQPGLYTGPVTALDLAPTFLAAAGGNPAQRPGDGYNVAPLLSGAQPVDPHQAIVWRNMGAWAVSKGDWKLLAGSQSPPSNPLYHLSSDPREQVELSKQHPEIVADLLHELTFWEAQMQKPRWGPTTENQFDRFVYQGGLTPNWGDPIAWLQAGTTRLVTLHPLDSYANTTLEFRVNDDGDFTATNDLSRVSGQTFMLNQLRLTGVFHGNVDRHGTIDGKALLFVKSLGGQLPQIRLDATSDTPAGFTYTINNPLTLLDNLEITGDGTQRLIINGGISDYLQPRDVTKTGTSQVTLTGKSTFKGTLRIDDGQLRIRGGDAAVTGAAAIIIGAAGDLTLDGGTIDVPLLDNSAGGMFHFLGGSLHADQIIGDIFDDGDAPLQFPGNQVIHGNFTQRNGALQIGIGSAADGSSDQISIDGMAAIDGTLTIRPAPGFLLRPGQSYQLLTAAGGLHGTFRNLIFPTLGEITGHLIYGANSLTLLIDSAAEPGLTGDFNDDGVVDAADYTLWRDTLGSTTRLAADGNHNGMIDANDYPIWKSHFGDRADGGAPTPVPEPAAILLMAIGSLFLAAAHRRVSCFFSA
jgi:autotransporter-associated beta strand protein